MEQEHRGIIEHIIDVYVRHKNRAALDNLKLYRQKLLIEIGARPASVYNWGKTISVIEEDLGHINAGLERLQPR